MLLTYYDDNTGERTELSAADLGAWSARTAGMLREGCRLRPGSRIAVLLPPHWQTAAVLLGAWAAGMALSLRPESTAGLAPLGPGANDPLDATFVARHRIGSWIEDIPDATHRYVLGLAPHGAPLADVPLGYLDYVTEIQRYADSPPPYRQVLPSAPATVDGTSHGAWAALATEIGHSAGIRAGDRVLVDATEHENPVRWLLAPMVLGASVVLCANLNRTRLDDRMAREGVTRVL
ncbi:TIGR03089 family protein [Hamadaea tsunoensis]|uniref:TIGR03089 family protein n=1 Tax=Hamadaea tsunoensis TaxID=53368 RepID=UPI000412F0CE|nr:TIGR03089 family protein [Hamadaea tsunoensis]